MTPTDLAPAPPTAKPAAPAQSPETPAHGIQGAPASPAPGAPSELGSVDARLAAARENLNRARQKTLDYQAEGRAAEMNLKGGPVKAIWNVKEEIWLLERQKANPHHKILGQATVVGVKNAAGVITETPQVSGTGRIVDFLEFRGERVVGGDLKSAAELKASIKGGVRLGPLDAELRPKSKVGEQHEREAAVLDAAGEGSKLVIRGTNVKTGEVETVEVESKNYSSEVLTYEDVRPN